MITINLITEESIYPERERDRITALIERDHLSSASRLLFRSKTQYPDLYARLHAAALKKTKSFFDPWLKSLDGDSKDLAEYLRDSFFDLCRANSGRYLSHNPEETDCR